MTGGTKFTGSLAEIFCPPPPPPPGPKLAFLVRPGGQNFSGDQIFRSSVPGPYAFIYGTDASMEEIEKFPTEDQLQLYLWQRASFMDTGHSPSDKADSLRLKLAQLSYYTFKK